MVPELLDWVALGIYPQTPSYSDLYLVTSDSAATVGRLLPGDLDTTRSGGSKFCRLHAGWLRGQVDFQHI